jgi:hypothetical protein
MGIFKKEKEKTKAHMKNRITSALAQLLRDKNGCHSLREVATALFILVLLISWVADQFFGLQIPEHMFYGFVSLVGAGCFGYSIEKKTTI